MIMRPGGGGGGPATAEQFFYAGKQLEVVKSIKYLGITFSQLSKAHGFACCAEELAACRCLGQANDTLFALLCFEIPTW